MQKFKSVENLINQLKPEKPVYCIRKHSVTKSSKFFQKNFPGDILYAVKTNPHPLIIKTLIDSGIKNCKIEGKDSQEWKLVDGIDLIVHIFHPEKRKFYELEKMWSELIPKEKLII